MFAEESSVLNVTSACEQDGEDACCGCAKVVAGINEGRKENAQGDN